MGKKIGVRQAVGVNSSTIRTIRIILMEKGLTSNKMAILVGGPDWPTSVLTGILGCSYKQMIIGSAPFIVTIPVTVLAGALQLKAKESPAMAAAAGTILMLASMTQAGCGLLAMVAIEDVARAKKEELDNQELDAEVLIADEKSLLDMAKFERLTEWSVLPIVAKGILIVDATMMFISIQLFVGFECFESLDLIPIDDVMGPIDGPPLNGAVIENLIKPTGWIALGFHFVSTCFLLLATCYLLPQSNLPTATRSLRARGAGGD